MEPGDDKKLSKLLQEWQLPGAPASLDSRVLRAQKPWWRNSIRLPIPVALAIAAALIIMSIALLRQHPTPPAQQTSINLADFHPVKDLNVRILRGTHAPK